GFDYALGPTTSLTVNYLFVHGDQLSRSTDINVGASSPFVFVVPSTGEQFIHYRFAAGPFTSFARIIAFQSSAESTYNGLTVEMNRRFSSGLQGRAAYTIGKVTDTVPDATAVVPASADDAKFASNPADFEADRAPGDNDQRHRLVFSGYWDLGYWRQSKGLVHFLLSGWSTSWIATAASGQPYSEAITNDVNRDGNTRNAIPPGTRNGRTTPRLYNVDARLARHIGLVGPVRLELIGEAFNLFNRTNIT